MDSMLKLMSVLTRDKRYSDWLNEDSATKEGMNMCEVLDKIVARGEARGEIRGTQKTLVNLVKKNLLSIRDAALEAGMSEEAFKKLAKAM